MRAIIYERFGGPEVLHAAERPAPVLPVDGVLVRMAATSVNVIDVRSRLGLLAPLVDKKFPKIPGADIAGTVIAVGAKAQGVAVGDRVVGATNPFKGGAFAEIVALPAAALARIPDKLSDEQAATLPIAAVAAYQSLFELGKLTSGQRVLLYGSAGAMGLFAIELAKEAGAHVTAIAGRNGQSAMREAGADQVIDYRAGPVRLDGPYDVIVDMSGAFPFGQARRHLAPKGRYIDPSPTIPKVIGSKLANLFRRQKNEMLMTKVTSQKLGDLLGRVADGRLTPHIAHRFPLSQAASAFATQEAGGVVGKVVLVWDPI